MKCDIFRENIHGYLDLQLPGRQMAVFEAHLEGCGDCRKLCREFLMVKGALATRLAMPDAASTRLLCRLEQRRQHSLLDCWNRMTVGFLTALRDMERSVVWSRIAALPLTVFLFVALVNQFPAVRLEPGRVPVLNLQGWTASGDFKPPVVRRFETRQSHARFRHLVDTAWRLPYEDSLALVAEVTREGHAEVESVLQYPRSRALLDAVGVTLRESEFSVVQESSRPFVIFSFQKIDVWETQQGL